MRRISRWIVLVTFAVFAMQALAEAQQMLAPTIPAPANSQSPTWQQSQPHIATSRERQNMQQHFADVHAMELQGRNATLGALSPAHRVLLAQIVGELAVSPNPDAEGAAHRLDAALSAGEIRAVVTAEQNTQAQIFAEVRSFAPPALLEHIPSRGSTSPMSSASARFMGTADAGTILLRNVAMGMMPFRNMVFGGAYGQMRR